VQGEVPAGDPVEDFGKEAAAPHRGERLEPAVRARNDGRSVAFEASLRDRAQDGTRRQWKVHAQDENPVGDFFQGAGHTVDRGVLVGSVQQQPAGAGVELRRAFGDDVDLLEDLGKPARLVSQQRRRPIRKRRLGDSHPPRGAARENGRRDRDLHRSDASIGESRFAAAPGVE
jgi:hypothetical protein